jgi:hypothetical protein
MANQSNQHAVASFGYALAVANLLPAALVIDKEKNAALLGAMNAASGHHWITHGVVITLVFVVLGLALGPLLAGSPAGKPPALDRVTAAIAGSTIVSGLVIAAFFLFAG